MKEEYSLTEFGHSNYNQIKKLERISDNKYKIVSKWIDHPDENPYLRIGYDFATNEIKYVDLCGGPFISVGFTLQDGCVVDHFDHDDFENIVVVIKENN